jgi:hypothetical protein
MATNPNPNFSKSVLEKLIVEWGNIGIVDILIRHAVKAAQRVASLCRKISLFKYSSASMHGANRKRWNGV